MEGKSKVLREQEPISLFRSIVGSGIYICQERHDVAFTVLELASRMSSPTAMSFHRLKKFLGYLKKLNFHKQEKATPRKEKAIGAWKHSQIQIGVETRAKKKANVRRVPCFEQLSIVQQQQDTEDHYLHVKQSCAQ